MAEALAGFRKYIEYLATGKLDVYLDSIKREDKLTDFGVDLPLTQIFSFTSLASIKIRNGLRACFISVKVMVRQSIYLASLDRTALGKPSGSNDFKIATQMLQNMSTWRKGESSQDHSNNAFATHRAFAMLLCARFFILNQFVQQLPPHTNVMDARRRWVLAQVLPPCLPSSADLFVEVLQALRRTETDILLKIISSLLKTITERKDLFPMEIRTPLFIVIDKAQVAAEDLKFFRSGSGDLLPILREMVDFFLSRSFFKKIILSGTGLSTQLVKYAPVRSVAAKQVPNGKVPLVFTDVGRFTRDDSSQETYIRRYLTLSNDNISDRRLLERMMYWFSGRYRLTASLIELLLYSENVPRHRILTLFAEHLTGFKITDAIDLEAGEPPISPDLYRKIKTYQPLIGLDHLVKEGELSNRMELIECLADALMRWTLGSELTSISIDRNIHDIIELGVGFLDQMPGIYAFDLEVTHPVYISEPLVVLSLSSLFEKHDWTTRKNWMVKSFRNALKPLSLGFVVENALLLVLMEVFGGKSSLLSDVCRCSTELGSRKLTLVSLKRVAGGELQSCPVSWNSGSSDRLGLKAQSPEDVLKFLENPDGKAFLFPDNHMGADLLCFLQTEETKELILAAFQSKVTPDLNLGTWKKAINSVTPKFFYTVVTNGKRDRYAPVSYYPDLENDLAKALEKILGKEKQEERKAPNIADTYREKLHSSKRSTPRSSSPSDRQTPRTLHIIVNPYNKKAQKHHKGEADVAVFRWRLVKDYIGSTADSVVKTREWVKL
ncbi:hypothetical protein F5887DRAFT_1091838 [Amanita rubescens]|nr:hypothetical protein F5887DRAFT_1091838 [Amanita rubescens]